MEYSVQLNGQMVSSPESKDSPSEGNAEFSTLSKLKGLAKDDKTENAMLRSRIDEQSQLIMILKNRADEAFKRTSTLERINKELTEFRDNAKENIDHEIRKFNILDKRFNDLASNHEEMIKYKDEYKRVNVELRQENERLKDENARLFSKAIVEKDDKIRLLEGKLASVKDQYSSLETKYSFRERKLNTPTNDYRDSKFLTENWIKDLKSTYSAKAREKERQLAEAQMRAKILEERRKQDEADLERKIRKQMHIHKKTPAIVDDLPVSDISSSEDEDDDVQIVEEEGEESLPELTGEMENIISNALSRGNPGQVLVDKFRLQITKGDIATLAGLSWLNDQVINFYMNLLMERGEKEGYSKVYAFNTFFYPKVMSGGQSAVKRWTRRVDVLAVDYILIPVHLGMHWCLAVINFKKKDIQYYDSLGGNNTQCLNALKQYLCDESLDKKKTEFNLNGWKSTIVKDIPQQMNGSDCGMFACKYAEYITREAPITFTQTDMPYFRRRMVYEIVSAKLLQ